MSDVANTALLKPLDTFAGRHLGPRDSSLHEMLATVGADSLDDLMDQTIPASIRLDRPLNLPPPLSESEALADLRDLADQNKVYRSYIGMGYYGCITPSVILRDIMENPGWYTQYTPYQAEIAQGRLEALLNFQTMVSDLTGMEIANSSLLDEGTAAAEAMTLCKRAQSRKSKAETFFVSELCHPQTIDLIHTRAAPMGYQVIVGDHHSYDFSQPTFGVLVQYPATDGSLLEYDDFIARAHEHGALAVVATDLLALTLLRPPGEFGADVVVGNSQRLGVPMGYGGPHAAFMSTKDTHKRLMPGRLIGVSTDATGKPALRLALQTREQHIRRDKATSNICTAQVLLAVMASMYGVYHGPEGLTRIARRVRLLTQILATSLQNEGYTINNSPVFDTLQISGGRSARMRSAMPHWIVKLTCATLMTARLAFSGRNRIRADLRMF
jgi:glycine dehydrogenase